MPGITYPPAPPKLSICCDPPPPPEFTTYCDPAAAPEPINCEPPAPTEFVPPRLLRPCLGTKDLFLICSCLFFDLWPRVFTRFSCSTSCFLYCSRRLLMRSFFTSSLPHLRIPSRRTLCFFLLTGSPSRKSAGSETFTLFSAFSTLGGGRYDFLKISH